MAGNPNWIKGGKSPNPSGGRNNARFLTQALTMKFCDDPKLAQRIAARLVTIATEEEDPRVATAAMQMIWDRLEGKAIQTIDVNQTITDLSPVDRINRLRELQGKTIIDVKPEPVTQPRLPQIANGANTVRKPSP